MRPLFAFWGLVHSRPKRAMVRSSSAGDFMAMILAAALSAGAIATLTDWLFLGVLFREARGNYPEVWWPAIRDGETKPAKIWTVLLGFVASFGIVMLCARSGPASIAQGLTIAALAFIAPAALLLTAFQFIKMDLWVMAAAGFAWLTRFLIAGLIAGLLLP